MITIWTQRHSRSAEAASVQLPGTVFPRARQEEGGQRPRSQLKAAARGEHDRPALGGSRKGTPQKRPLLLENTWGSPQATQLHRYTRTVKTEHNTIPRFFQDLAKYIFPFGKKKNLYIFYDTFYYRTPTLM